MPLKQWVIIGFGVFLYAANAIRVTRNEPNLSGYELRWKLLPSVLLLAFGLVVAMFLARGGRPVTAF